MTLEQLARRVEEIERRLDTRPPTGSKAELLKAVEDFRGDSDFWARVAEECRRLREDDRREAGR